MCVCQVIKTGIAKKTRYNDMRRSETRKSLKVQKKGENGSNSFYVRI